MCLAVYVCKEQFVILILSTKESLIYYSFHTCHCYPKPIFPFVNIMIFITYIVQIQNFTLLTNKYGKTKQASKPTRNFQNFQTKY